AEDAVRDGHVTGVRTCALPICARRHAPCRSRCGRRRRPRSAACRPVPVPALPRFAGGAVGHIGYDMARAFERLPERAGDDLGLPDACLLLAESLLVFDNVAQKIKVVSHVHVREGESLEAAYDAAVARIDALVA